MVAQYDIRAALYYAKIWRAKSDKSKLKELQENGKTRQELKADRMIVATALANGSECIYSHDGGLKVFGDGFIEVRSVPPGPQQPNLL
jgi:predicted nucleic acid-binding protein